MKKFVLILFFCLSLTETFCYITHAGVELEDEVHSILKRFADTDHEFTHHDMAMVLHEKEPNSFHRISKRDLQRVTESKNTHRIRLELSSGSSIHLNLKKRSLFDSNSQFYENNEAGLVKRSTPVDDCFLTGDMEMDGNSGGMASVALCNGFHGTASIDGTEYYIHPADGIIEDQMVHILSRRSLKESQSEYFGDEVYNDTVEYHGTNKREARNYYEMDKSRFKREVNAETYKTATSFVIEMAVFVDAEYNRFIGKIAPGREDEYVLLGLAAASAIYGNKEKVGYDVTIKIKHYERWNIDPDGYQFAESLSKNLNSICELTRDKYKYDMHFLHTGVTKQRGPAAGMAYTGGVCGYYRCANILSTSIGRWNYIAHEIGHSLGFSHHFAAKCPNRIKSLANGFMGKGGAHFSPCNKWELNDFFSRGNGQCLFEETGVTDTPEDYANLAALFPGQYMAPDEQCRLLGGEGFEYFRPFDLDGEKECMAFMCINRNKNSPEYMKVVKRFALMGFPCGDERYCTRTAGCSSWGTQLVSWDIQYLRSLKKEHHWSEWSENWSECSRSCGTGVQIKRRTCMIDRGPFVNQFCKGEPIQYRLCNRESCPGDPTNVKKLRKARGKEVCERFYKNNVTLPGSSYLPSIGSLWIGDRSARAFKGRDDCLLMCKRNPRDWNIVDAIFPDGTPCLKSRLRTSLIKRYNIDLRCVQGACQEKSDCPENAKKDSCGVCGGDPSHCVSLVVDKTKDVPRGETATLAKFPAGTSRIDVSMVWWKNKEVRFEVWNGKGEKIFGKGALFPKSKYPDNRPAEYAGAKWAFAHASFLRTDGPIDQEIILKATRKGHPIKEIFIDYLLPS